MQLMAWSHHFTTGIATVDEQHRTLVNMINEAAPHLAGDNASARRVAGPLLDRLAGYAVQHFAHEERLMHEVQVDPGYQVQHEQSHAQFVAEVQRMRQQYESGGGLNGTDLLHFLTSWLTFHILAEDRRLARQILAIRCGASAEQALAALKTPEGAPHAAFTGALVDLFGLLTHRNQELTEVNDQLRAMRDALQAANESLEQRVAQRTRELARANAELQREQASLHRSLQRLEQTQLSLRQAEKMAAIGQLAAGVAHEINNPLGFVTANLGTLGSYATTLMALAREQHHLLERHAPQHLPELNHLHAQAELDYLATDLPVMLDETRVGLERVRRIVAELRSLAEDDASHWTVVELDPLAHAVAQQLRQHASGQRDWSLALQSAASVYCNPAQLAQLLNNLLLNACEATAQGGHIELGTARVGNEVVVLVKDSGTGIAPQLQQRIFEPFFTTKPPGRGTGLGLSTAWVIAQRHGGSLSVRSQPGQGSSFRLVLPLHASDESTPTHHDA